MTIEILFSFYLILAATSDKDFPDGPTNRWYKSLKQPQTGISCCDISDCEPVDSRTASDHYEVFINDKWWAVPGKVILESTPNPTGSAVACWNRRNLQSDGSPQFYCFIPGGGV